MKATRLFLEFFNNEKAGGFVLIACTLFSLLLANSVFGDTYLHFWHTSIAGNSLAHWINDGLMAIFFLLIGLELERELYIGELSSLKNALLPVLAAIGGMLVPAGFHLAFNHGSETQAGFGIPMATDIAFSLGVLSLFSKRVPFALKVFLTALAIVDDLGAIIIIALFYSKAILLNNLGIAFGIFAAMLVLNRLRVHNLLPYLIGGVAMWYFFLHSGIHATIAGVLLAFAIPFGDGGENSPSYLLQHWLHKPVSFGILPIFALANTAIVLGGGWQEELFSKNSLGIFTGLVIGKPMGILIFSALAVFLKFTSLPENTSWRHLAGAGFLAGIGFTMSIFVTLLAFEAAALVKASQISVLAASLTAGILGAIWLRWMVKPEGQVGQ